jgi:hypothetical protein
MSQIAEEASHSFLWIVATRRDDLPNLESGLGLGRNKLPLANYSLPLLDRHDLAARYPGIIFIFAISPTHRQVGGVRLP